MARKGHVQRYSQAAFSIALETGELDRWQSDLNKAAFLSEDAELMAALESPRLRFADKARFLSERLGDINPLALNLVNLLVAKNNLAMIDDIADGYQRLLDSYRGRERAEVTTAVPLDDEGKRRLAERLGVVIGKEIVLDLKVDAGIIGGIIARVGGKLLDGSTRTRLASLNKEFIGAGGQERR